jgi:hypothetical protein
MKKNILGIGITLIITFVFVFIFFKPFLYNPNSFVVSKSVDAVKSYYNFSYALKYGSGMKHEGINYPYGEHIQMENTHPTHQFFFRQFNKIFDLSNHGVAIINLSMIFSLFLVVPFLFLILRRYKMPVWYSVLITLIILFLSPQIGRISGHFEMAYLFFIPMWWYFLLRLREGKRTVLWGLLLVTTSLLAGYTSAWYAAMFALFIFGIILSDLWIGRKNLRPYIKHGLMLFIIAIIPLLAVKGLQSITDWASDRPTNPYGFYVFHSNIFSIFLPFDRLMQTWFDYYYTNILKINWEGLANVGLPASVVAFVLVCLILYRFYTRKKISALFPITEYNPFLISAFLVLLFSMCFPFKWGMGFLLDVIPMVKQFRALGRFSWIFYYVFTVYASIMIYRYYLQLKENGNAKKAIVLLISVFLFWSYDAYLWTTSYFSIVINNNDRLESDGTMFMKRFDEMKHKPEDFQAIFYLPYANTSGDKMFFERGLNAFNEAMKLSYHTKLPIIQSFSPRISMSHALSSIQLLADSSIQKTRLKDMNEKPFLILKVHTDMNDQEEWLLSHSDSIWGDEWLTFYEFSPETYKKSYANWLFWSDSVKHTLSGNELIKSDTTLASIIYLDFDKGKSEYIFAGSGALYKKNKQVELFNEDLFGKGFRGMYELTFWVYFNQEEYDMPKPMFSEIDKYDFPIEQYLLNTREEHNVYNNWVRVDHVFEIKPGVKYQLMVSGQQISIDNLILKPLDKNVYLKFDNGAEMMNNFVMER